MSNPARRRAAGGVNRAIRRPGWIAFLLVACVLGSGVVIAQHPDAAVAADYPSWDEVQAARQSKAATEAEVARVQSALTGLQANVDSTQAASRQMGDLYQAAQQKYDEAAFRAAELRKQADAAQTAASKSRQQAAELAARLSRSGGDDVSTRLFFSGAKAKSLLAQLGLASMVKSQSAGLYEKATQDQNTAQSLTNQADVAKAALKILADAARAAFETAATAAEAAAAALSEQQDNIARLQAQLATLTTNVDHLESEYTAGIKAQWGDAAGLGAGKISSTGWARPAGGHISSPFGFRLNPYTNAYAFHSGTDLGASCNSPIYAAHGGTVTYAGWNGGYGNFILIEDGDGLSTGYGHIVDGGVHVAIGQTVGVGQPIALVGSTGHSTGCHLHFEVRNGGIATDAVPFMRDNGIELAN